MGETDPQRTAIAVVIACFNDGATLTEAVRSVQGQQRLGELVVIDDGSTDQATVDVCAQLRREGVHVVRRDNGGMAVARMTGVAATRAPYVLALDADDVLLPGGLATLASALDDDPRLALAWGDYESFGERSWLVRTAPTLDPWSITYLNDIPSTMLVRRSALLAADGWQPAAEGYCDWDLLMALAERGQRGRRVARAIYGHRMHPGRLGTKGWERHGDLTAAMRARHPSLFGARRRAWRSSSEPLALRIALPMIFRLPLPLRRRFVLASAACHLAHRRGVRVLLTLFMRRDPAATARRRDADTA